MFEKSGPLVILATWGGFFLVLFLVFKVLDTEFFRGDPDLGGESTPIKNEKTALAHAYCAQQVAQRLNLDETGTHALDEYTAWDIGFNRYLVKARIERADDPTRTHQYLCKIIYQGDNENEAENWLVQSIDYVQ